MIIGYTKVLQFTTTKPAVPPKEEGTVNTITLKDDEIELTDEKITDFCCDRNTTSLPTATADTIITPTTSTNELCDSKYTLYWQVLVLRGRIDDGLN